MPAKSHETTHQEIYNAGVVIRSSEHGQIREILFYRAFPGVDLSTAAQDCVAQAERFTTGIEFRFDDTRLMVDQTWSARRIVKEVCKSRLQAREEFASSGTTPNISMKCAIHLK